MSAATATMIIPLPTIVGVLAGPPREPDHHEVGRRETERVADAVPVDGERTELERDRVRGEVEHPGSVAARLPILRRG